MVILDFIKLVRQNSFDTVNLLINKYKEILDQTDDTGETGFLLACRLENLILIKSLIDKYP